MAALCQKLVFWWRLPLKSLLSKPSNFGTSITFGEKSRANEKKKKSKSLLIFAKIVFIRNQILKSSKGSDKFLA